MLRRLATSYPVTLAASLYFSPQRAVPKRIQSPIHHWLQRPIAPRRRPVESHSRCSRPGGGTQATFETPSAERRSAALCSSLAAAEPPAEMGAETGIAWTTSGDPDIACLTAFADKTRSTRGQVRLASRLHRYVYRKGSMAATPMWCVHGAMDAKMVHRRRDGAVPTHFRRQANLGARPRRRAPPGQARPRARRGMSARDGPEPPPLCAGGAGPYGGRLPRPRLQLRR
jgi:hypothetical protein